jgi:hypothetical protein
MDSEQSSDVQFGKFIIFSLFRLNNIQTLILSHYSFIMLNPYQLCAAHKSTKTHRHFHVAMYFAKTACSITFQISIHAQRVIFLATHAISQNFVHCHTCVMILLQWKH